MTASLLPEIYKKCIVHGCENHTDQGKFGDSLCLPCHTFLSNGVLEYRGNTFIAKVGRDLHQVTEELLRWRRMFKPFGEIPSEAWTAVHKTQIVWRPVSELPKEYRETIVLVTTGDDVVLPALIREFEGAQIWIIEGRPCSPTYVLAWADLPKPYVPPKPKPACYMWVDENNEAHLGKAPHPKFKSWEVGEDALKSAGLAKAP